jgi:hypothetical protein
MRLEDRHTGKRGKYRPEANNPHDGADSDRMVRLAPCLRRHGVNVPDPQPGQPLKVNDQGQDRQGSSRPTRPASARSGERGGRTG